MNLEARGTRMSALRAWMLRGLPQGNARRADGAANRTNEPGGVNCGRRRVGVHQQGFSLIEMLLVLGIIAFIATMLATNIFGAKVKADVKAAQAGVRKVATAIDQFYLDSGSIPTSMNELVTRPGNVSNWGGPYLNESQTKDPWGTPYVIKVPAEGGQPYAVISLGSDKAPGGKDTAADIDNNQ
jgi:general secretion pathway protein G